MAENRHPDVERREIHHEASDVNTWAVGKFAIALVLLCGVALLILVGLFKYFQSSEEPPVAGAISLENRVPPSPRLQNNPIQDLKAMRAAEDSVLTSYGWVDQKNGIARIPIARAIDLLAQRGLPSRPQAAAATAVTVPTESGLGEIMQRPGGPLSGEKQ